MGFFVTLSHLEIPNGVYTLLEDSRRFYGKPSYYAYLQALRVFSRKGRVADCEKLLNMYTQDYGKPSDIKIITPLVNAYGALGKVDDVKRLMEVMRNDHKLEPDVFVWNILLKANAANDDTLGAFWVVERMQRAGVQPDVRTYTTLLNLLARRGDFSTLLDVFEKFKELDIDIDRPLMKPVVAALCESERYTAAEALAERITRLNLRGSPTPLWNVLLSKYASMPDVYSLRRAHEKMISLGVSPDSMTYGALILALTLSGHTSSAVLILERLHRSRRLHANEFHYALILSGYLRENNRDMVHVIYNEIKNRFRQPGISANLSALRSCISRDLQLHSEREGDDYPGELVLHHAEQFLDTVMDQSSDGNVVLGGPQPGTLRRSTKETFPSLFYEALMEAYAKHGEIDRVAQLFEKLNEEQHRLRPNDIYATPHVFRVLMLAHLRAEDHEALASCWRSFFKGMRLLATPVPESPSNMTEPIIPAYKFSLSYCISLYMRSLASQDEYEQIKTLISEVEEAGFGLTTDNWSLYIKLLALSDAPENQFSAFRLFEKLFIRNFPGWQEIIRGYAKRPPDAPPSLDLLEDTAYNQRGKPLRVLGKKGRRAWAKIRPDYMQPTYSTMVYLASAYLSFQARAVVDGGAELSKLSEVGPRTLMTLGEMPVLNERFQKTLLNGRASSGKPYPEEIDAKSPVWEGGILGPGGRRADTSPLELTSLDGRLIPRKNRPYLRPLMHFTSEPDEEDMMWIIEEDRKWRETLRERLHAPRESRDTDAIVRREDELDVEDERLYDIYPLNNRRLSTGVGKHTLNAHPRRS
ncbi:hypothetical protein KEM54_002200 [Ascosphaera aggregata]|nr:hypothetical protein KEM54_002200 [Ascosphaera aggregata]